MSALNLRATSPLELQDELAAARSGTPYLIYRDLTGARRIVPLDSNSGRLTIGRRPGNDVALPWDPNVSRLHAELELIGPEWTLSDEGLSRNGSYVNGIRQTGRRRLRNGDILRVGGTSILYRTADAQTDPTLAEPEAIPVPRLSELQRRILLALARPCFTPDTLNLPASNQQIAAELGYSVDAVKAHLRVLFHKFGLDDQPQNQKRLKLVDHAFRRGLISSRDF